MADLDLILEAERRGILPPDRKSALDEARRRGLIATPAAQPSGQPTLDRRAEDVLGIDPTLDRAALLPIARTRDGEMTFALPQAAVDVAKSALLPGHVAQGGAYSETDVTRAALDINPMARSVASRTRLPKIGQIAKEADPAKLQKHSASLYEAARSRGVKVSADSFADNLARLETDISKFGSSKTLHAKATGVFAEWTKRIGRDLDLEDLEILRREAGEVVKGAGTDSERAIGTKMVRFIDDYIDNLKPTDVVAGDKTGVNEMLKSARALWQRKVKVERVDEIFEQAATQASGFENGLRIEFRKIVRDPKKRRGWSAAELRAMRSVVNGGPVRQGLRFLSHLGWPVENSNRFLGATIGGTVGAVGGGMVGGPVGSGIGAAAVPAAGHIAGRTAAAQTRNAADTVKAIAATGGKLPPTDNGMLRTLRRGAGPTVATQLPEGPLEVGPNGGAMVNGVEVF